MIIQKNKNHKKQIIIFIIVILLFLITILLVKINNNKKHQQYLQQEKQRVMQYTALTDFKTIQEVAIYLDCTFIKQETSKEENITYDIYMEIPIQPLEDDKNNQSFYEKLIQYSAYVLDYKNFIIIDEKNENSIVVYCNEETSQVGKYYINGINNYFDIHKSEKNVDNINIIEPISVNVNSNELKLIIENSWKTANIEIGTLENTYKNYDIYFEEGFQIRKTNAKVFNIIFNEKYTSNIVNNLNTSSSKEEIIKTLGTPHFEIGKLIGYKCENMYIFFYNSEISIYRVEKYETKNIAKIIEKYKSTDNIIDFINEIKSEWKDYDKYEYDEDYVFLQYASKGLCIKYDSTLKNGVVFYNNYEGFAYGDTTFEDILNTEDSLPENIYVENEDLVFKTEINRINTLDDYTKTNNYATKLIKNISNEFKTQEEYINNNYYSIRFISIGKKHPNSELRESINMGIWYDDYNFIYSVNGKGIYLYNAQTRKYITIITGDENYELKRIENNVLYYNETSVAVNI